MLGMSVRILAVVAAAALLAGPVTAHRNSKKQLEGSLTELTGKVVKLDRGLEISYILLETRNIDRDGQPQPGERTLWMVSADPAALKSTGLTRAVLAEGTTITVSGYQVADDRCDSPMASGNKSTRCWFAGRQITLADGCVNFIGRSPAAFGKKPLTWGTNIPKDGLENADRSRCGD